MNNIHVMRILGRFNESDKKIENKKKYTLLLDLEIKMPEKCNSLFLLCCTYCVWLFFLLCIIAH
jgi:hypothetical protein